MADDITQGVPTGWMTPGKGAANTLHPALLGDVDANKPAPQVNNAFSKPEPAAAPAKRAPRKATGAAAAVRSAVTRGRGKAAAAEEQTAE